MCAVSMIADHYREKWQDRYPVFLPPLPPSGPVVIHGGPTREEFNALKKEVLEMKKLLKRAKDYDERTDQKDCEMEEKVAVLRKVADIVGVDLKDVLP